MTAATNYLESAIIDHVFGGVPFVAPTTYHVQMHVGDPGEDALSNVAAESTRQTITFGTEAGGAISTDVSPAATWTNVPATETWTHVSLWDSLVGGNPLAKGPLVASIPVVATGDGYLTSLTVSLD